MATIQDIKSNAALVKNATGIGENTAERVGGVLADMTDYLYEKKDELGTDGNAVMSQQAVTKAITNVNANIGISEYETFSDAKAYSIGDIVRYNGLLYEFIADHEIGEWNSGEVQNSSISSVTSLLRNRLRMKFNGSFIRIKMFCPKGTSIKLTIENTGNDAGYFNSTVSYKNGTPWYFNSQLIQGNSTTTVEKTIDSDIDYFIIQDINNRGGNVIIEYGSLSDAIVNINEQTTDYIGPFIVKGAATNTDTPSMSLGGEGSLCIDGYPVKEGEKWVYSGYAYWHTAWIKKEDNSIDESFLVTGTYNKKEFTIPCDGMLYAWGIISDSVPPFNCYKVSENKTLQEQISDLQSDIIEEQQNTKDFKENFRNITTEYGYYMQDKTFVPSPDKTNKAVKEYNVKAGEIYSYTGHNMWTGAFLRKSDGNIIDFNVPANATDFRFEIPEDGKLCAWGQNNGDYLNTFVLYCVENKTDSAAWQGKFNSEKALQEIENLGISTNENKYTKDDFTVTTWNCAKTEDENGITIIQTSSDSDYNINFKNNAAVNSGSFIFVRARVLSDKDVWVQVTTYSQATDQRTCFIFIEANKEKEIYFRGTVANENGVLNVMFNFAKEQSGINFTIKSITACIDNYDAWSTSEEKATLKEFGNNNKVYIVDKEGGGHFLSISQACTTLKGIFDNTTPVTILVKNGLYNKEVSPYTTIAYPYAAIIKESNRISIIGESKENTIIEYTNENPNRLNVIEVGSSDCVIKNLTIKSLKGNTYDTNLDDAAHTNCYCLHIDLGPDMDETYGRNYKTLIENCYLYSECQSPIGAGLTNGQTICVDKCKIISDSKTGTSMGACYIHAKASGDAGENMGVEIRHCDLISLDNTKALTLSDVGDSKYINIPCEIIGNLLYSNGEDIIDQNFKENHKLLGYSMGNNVDDLNYKQI